MGMDAQHIRDRIEHFRQLKYNWGSYDEYPPSKTLLDYIHSNAERFATLFEGVTVIGIFPSCEGAVRFEYEFDNTSFEVVVEDFGKVPEKNETP